ncbi:MAG: TonB-dependent receptor, partial [Kordiimonadaceae bacterium]|nr:TonB-dependent receptor [Kordiimonadaceae bacterium]
LTQSVPNFAHNGNGSTLSATGIRGIVAATRNIGFESGMGVYIDEIYVGRPSAFNQNLDDIQQLEVLRGPQGTLFGRNTIAGAVNITTKKPSEEFEGRLKATVGDRGRANVSGFLSGPIISDKLYGKVSLYTVNRNGFVENAFDDENLSNEDRQGYRVSLVFQPSDTLEVTLSADDMKERTNRLFTQFRSVDPTSPLAGLYGAAFAGNPCCLAAGVVPNLTSQDAGPTENRDLSGQSLKVVWDLNSGHTITSISSRRETDFLLVADDDTTPVLVSHSTFRDTSDLFTQELRLNSVDDDTFNYVVGLYYQNTDSSSTRATTIGTPGVFAGFPNFTNGAGVAITDADGNIIVPIGAIDSQATVKSESFAAFGSLNYSVSEAVTATVGLRYTSEDKSLVFAQQNGTFTGHPTVNASPEIEDSGLSGNISFRYAFDEGSNLYASFARGFKSGGFNPDIVPNDDIVFGEEIAHTFEIGLKSTWMDSRIRLNAAAFYTDYKDQQVQRLGVSSAGGTGFQITNADSKILGGEIELRAMPFENFEFGFTLGLLDHEYKGFGNCSTTEDTQVDVGGQFVLIDCTGNKLSYVPDVTYNLMAQYTLPTSFGEFFARVDHGYKGSSFSEPGNFARTFIPSSNKTDIRVGYLSEDGLFEVSAWGKNIGDNEDLQFSWYIPSFQASYQSFSIGSEYGIDFILNF